MSPASFNTKHARFDRCVVIVKYFYFSLPLVYSSSSRPSQTQRNPRPRSLESPPVFWGLGNIYLIVMYTCMFYFTDLIVIHVLIVSH